MSILLHIQVLKVDVGVGVGVTVGVGEGQLYVIKVSQPLDKSTIFIMIDVVSPKVIVAGGGYGFVSIVGNSK